MTSFVFQGKTFKIVEDTVDELVAGCKRCHFYGDPMGCSDVDGHWHRACATVTITTKR